MIAATADLHDVSFLRAAFLAFTPSQRTRTLVWSIDNMVNDQGRPYDHHAFPHLGAPGGPMDSFDDPLVRTISMQYATRLGKTFFAQCCLLKTAFTDPCPMMSASSVEKLCKEVIGRLYKTLEQRPKLESKLLKGETKRKQDTLELLDCVIYGAWSRSTSTLADKNIKVGHAGEFDKWEYFETSNEAHPHKLFEDRFKDYMSVRKIIFEGTPTIDGESPIESKRRAGWNCYYYVPCPHCQHYQYLSMGGADSEFGLKYDAGPDGKNGATAARSAYYQCIGCQGKIEDYSRAWMMQRGVWVPEGCDIVHEEALRVAETALADPEDYAWKGWSAADWTAGEPVRGGEDASYKLSSLYALSLGWGDIAREFVNSKAKPHLLQNFVNQWLGETWQVRRRAKDPSEVASMLRGDRMLGEIGEEIAILTLGVDVQEGHFVWVLCGWDIRENCYVIEYGEALTWKDLLGGVIAQRYDTLDGDPMELCMVGIDSGFATDEIYKMCSSVKGGRVRPTKGFDTLQKPFLPSNLESSHDQRRQNLARANKMSLWKFNKGYYQEWLQARLDGTNTGESLKLCIEAADDEDFIAQLTNNAPVQKGAKTIWEKIYEADADDYRDALVIARVCKDMFTTFKPGRIETRWRAREQARNAMRKPVVSESKPKPKMHDRPGGWLGGMK
ncbi:MAG TPA: terminase gpA endonuclease subunit [Planctomycetaceae bacterium]|nr:terminase gpA endonuclease subunit [Planctomycetaceae bacterium]